MIRSMKTKITTPNVSDVRVFYEAVFGMTVAEVWNEPDDRGVILAMPGARDEAYLEIYEGPASDLSGLSLQFRTGDLASFVDGLPKGVGFEGPKDRPWGSTYLYLRDPAGIQVIVYEGGL